MNLDIYTTEMSKSIWDKAFFMDKIPGVKCIIDFGCADGAMIRYLAPLFPDIMFIGYDINEELILKARTTSPYPANAIYFINIEDLEKYVWDNNYVEENLCINFSSVLHEVFSSTGGLDVIQTIIGKVEPRYITIRDMYCDDPVEFGTGKAAVDVLTIIDKVKSKLKYAEEFKDKFGVLSNWRDMTHLLMKLQWVDNGWEDEMKENYFSWKLEDVLKLTGNKYSPCFECRYQLPYLSEKWRQEYNWYNPDIHTHAQFILRRDE